MKIPKVIHYCWFGGKELPDLAKKCITSWRKYCPDYEIIEWNENNFDLDHCRYVKEAYQEKKWAFVSDYARFWILYNYGGVYLDTDVEIIKPIDDLIQRGAYMGCEPALQGMNNEECLNNLKYLVNPGLGISAPAQHPFLKRILDIYAERSFYKPSGELDLYTVVQTTTVALLEYGYLDSDKIQKVGDMTIYPVDYFCPKNYFTSVLKITPNTYSIHHYTASWQNIKEKKRFEVLQKLSLKFGNIAGYKIWRCYTLPFRFYDKFRLLGMKKTLLFALKKIWRQ